MRLDNPVVTMLKRFAEGCLLSIGFSLFYFTGILMTYRYMLTIPLVLAGLLLFCSLLVWAGSRYDRAADVIDVFSKTIALDMKETQSGYVNVLKALRPLYPYALVGGLVSGILLVVWVVPAALIYGLRHPGSPGYLFSFIVVVLSMVTVTGYFFSNKPSFPSPLDRVLFFSGGIIGQAGIVTFLL